MQSSPCIVRLSAVLMLAIAVGCKPETVQPGNATTMSTPEGTPAVASNAPSASNVASSNAASMASGAKKSTPKGKEFQLDRFSFSLPDRFTLDNEVDNGDIKLAVYKSTVNENETQAVVSMTLILDPKAAAEMNKNVRQFLVNFSAGTTDRIGIKVVNRSNHEPFDWNGLKGTQMKLLLKLPNQKDAGGVVYGLVQDNKVLVVAHLVYEGDPSKDMPEMLQHLSTMKSQ